MKPHLAAAVLTLLALTFPYGSAWADSRELETRLKADYKGKVLTLRHFYHGDHLKFHSDGSLATDATEGPWTVDGQIAVEKIQLHGGPHHAGGQQSHRKQQPVEPVALMGTRSRSGARIACTVFGAEPVGRRREILGGHD